jgi:hypothetical protein
MKLRIQGDTIRYRLNRVEVEAFANSGRTESIIHFLSSSLRYTLEMDGTAADVRAEYEPGLIRVLVPSALGARWARGDEVAMEGNQAQLSILIEKDFQCLHKGEEARDLDAYPNPAAVA